MKTTSFNELHEEFSKSSTYVEAFNKEIKRLTDHPDRHIKGHSTALLKRLQELNPQDHDNN